MRNEGNAVLRCFDPAQDRELVERPFDFAQGHESFDFTQDRELVERLAERQMDVFRQTRNYSLTRVTYSPVRVSTVILVPSLTKGGTRNW